jgi:16S rRNA (cytosine967-C5)-methyltransferase
MNARAIAARSLGQVLRAGQSLTKVLPPALKQIDPRDRGLLQELCYGVCRWQPLLQALLDRLLERPLDPRESTVRALLLIGLYQLHHLRVPEHAAVAETVAATRQLRKSWAAGLVNAVLRAFPRRRAELLAELETDPVARTAHPRWLLDALERDWPDDWPAIVAANNARPPLTLRVNPRRLDREDYRSRLAEAGWAAEPAAAPTALTLTEPVEPTRLPGFAEGWVSVQDAAAQWAAPLLDLRAGLRVLDACAAPGGKTGHLLECAPDLDLTALDRDVNRLERVRENLVRLRLKARLLAGDAERPAQWWNGVPYDRILVDAPCSATGVIRRHPDLKLLRRERDIAALAESQRAILCSLWPLLRPDGRLLYATCSVLRRENEEVVAAFLAAHPDAWEPPIVADWGRVHPHGRQILPGEAGMDGFYYAVLSKRATVLGGAPCRLSYRH